MSTVLVVAPHADDETLGCGGSLLRHSGLGDELHWLIMTSILEEGGYSQEKVRQRQIEIELVAREYQFTSTSQMGYRSATLDEVPMRELVGAVSKVIHRVKPATVYLPYRNDVHSDHGVVFDVVSACTKNFRYPTIKQVRAYETLSETEFSIQPNDTGFKPNLWIDISDYIEKKIQIMQLFRGEMEEHPFPRSEKSIRALATLRGSTAGVTAAESFITLKEIVS